MTKHIEITDKAHKRLKKLKEDTKKDFPEIKLTFKELINIILDDFEDSSDKEMR